MEVDLTAVSLKLKSEITQDVDFQMIEGWKSS